MTTKELSANELADYKCWWDSEGSAIIPLHGEDINEFSRYITQIAWSNGAYKSTALLRTIPALEAEIEALKTENQELSALCVEFNVLRKVGEK